MKMLLYIVLLYVAIAALTFAFQRRLLYLPFGGAPSDAALLRAGLELWPAGEQEYRALLAEDNAPADRGTVVVFHGNAGAAVDRSYYVDALVPLGYRVLLAEYPGYGGRAGRPSERALVADAQATLASAYAAFGPPLYLWGESLGAGVVGGAVAGEQTPIAGLILLTPWDTLPGLAQRVYWFFPTRWLLLDRYDNLQNLQAYAGPVAVVLAERDEVVPARHGLRLYASLPEPKRLWTLPGAGHNSWPTQPDGSWWRDVMMFVSR